MKEKKTNSILKIIEWKCNQKIEEDFDENNILNEYLKSNESFIITDMKFTKDGKKVIASDKGGRIIIFEKMKFNKLEHYFEFFSQDKDFDVFKGIEYSEEIKAIDVFPVNNNNDKIDILSASYRKIIYHRVYNDKINYFNFENEENENNLYVPKLNYCNLEKKMKIKKQFNYSNCKDINSLNINKFVTNNFISSDQHKVYLWDINRNNEDIYTPINIEEEFNSEKLTKSKYANFNPHIFFYGTNEGNLKLCDLRANTSQIKFETKFFEDKLPFKSSLKNTLLSIQDICTSFNNEYLFASRHYFHINLWDLRNKSEVLSKFLIYEPSINHLTYLKNNDYLKDKFTIDCNSEGNLILTGGYNGMFHIFDIEQRLNTQITINRNDSKIMNTNIIRKINSKGSCSYKEDDIKYYDINYDHKISHQIFSPLGNFIVIADYDRIYSYIGNIDKSD